MSCPSCACTKPLFSPPAPRVFRVLWVARCGPVLRRFTSADAFTGYVSELRRLCGSDAVELRTPTLAVCWLP